MNQIIGGAIIRLHPDDNVVVAGEGVEGFRILPTASFVSLAGVRKK